MPPPDQLKITAYQISIMRECEKGTQCNETVKNTTVKLRNDTQEVTYDYSWPIKAGSYYFVVSPIHEKCKCGEVKCTFVKSPKIVI
ncbi:jg25562, partial [Pararge aegeria aegeria]